MSFVNLVKYGAFKNKFCVKKRPVRGEGQLEAGVSDVSINYTTLHYSAVQPVDIYSFLIK